MGYIGNYCDIPNAIFYLLQEDFKRWPFLRDPVSPVGTLRALAPGDG